MPRMHSVPDRLSPLDVSFLYFEEPTTPMHVGGVAVFQAPEGGFDHDRLVDLICDADRVRAALPPAGPLGARAGWPTRSGWTTRTSTSPTTYAAPRCRDRAPTPSSPSSSPGCRAGRWTGPGRCGRCTSSRGCPTTGSRSSPRPTTRWSTASARSTSARSSSTPARTRASARSTPGGRRRSRPGPSWSPARSPRPCAGRPRSSTRCAAASSELPLDRRPAARRGRRPARRRDHGRPARAGQPAQRGHRRAAALRHGSRSTSTTTGASARRTAAPSTTSCSRPSPAPCAPGC